MTLDIRGVGLYDGVKNKSTYIIPDHGTVGDVYDRYEYVWDRLQSRPGLIDPNIVGASTTASAWAAHEGALNASKFVMLKEFCKTRFINNGTLMEDITIIPCFVRRDIPLSRFANYATLFKDGYITRQELDWNLGEAGIAAEIAVVGAGGTSWNMDPSIRLTDSEDWCRYIKMGRRRKMSIAPGQQITVTLKTRRAKVYCREDDDYSTLLSLKGERFYLYKVEGHVVADTGATATTNVQQGTAHFQFIVDKRLKFQQLPVIPRIAYTASGCIPYGEILAVQVNAAEAQSSILNPAVVNNANNA